jgi:hypothetical protein
MAKKKLYVVSNFNLGKGKNFEKGAVYEGDSQKELLDQGLIAAEGSKEAREVEQMLADAAEKSDQDEQREALDQDPKEKPKAKPAKKVAKRRGRKPKVKVDTEE